MKKIFEQISINIYIYISYIHKYLYNFIRRVCSINFTYDNIDDININNHIFIFSYSIETFNKILFIFALYVI